MGEIFISYSRKDSDFVDTLIGKLEEREFDVWLDREDIGGGAAWRAEISRAIRECDAFVVVLSTHSVDSINVTKELALADQHKRRIIPILIEDCEIPDEMHYQLAGLQMIHFTQRALEHGVDQLAKSLHAGGGRSERQPRREKPAKPLPAGQPPPQPPTTTSTTTPSLPQLLPGTWQVQILHTFTGMMAQLSIQVHANGFFQGQLVGPTGMLAVDGQWQITPPNQLVLQGRQTNGFQVAPYMVMIQFSQITPGSLSGVSGVGEQVTWQKIA